MNSSLKNAIIEFIANEFKLDPASIGEDLSFSSDLSLDPSAFADLLERMQEALDFTLPDDMLTDIDTLEDLINSIEGKPEKP